VDLATIVAAIRGPLSANELAYTQAVGVHDHRVTVETTLLRSSGEWLSAELELPIADASDARAIGSSITYGRRFGLTSLVHLCPHDGHQNITPWGVRFSISATGRLQAGQTRPVGVECTEATSSHTQCATC
jgi:hypothetical protein